MVLGMMVISLTNCVRNREELHRVKEERNILHAIKKKKKERKKERKATRIGYTLHRHHLLKHVIEGKIKRMGK